MILKLWISWFVFGQIRYQKNFDSYMVLEDDLPIGGLRLLEVDNPLILPINTQIRLLVTSSDVLHSWAIPSFGIKIDACPRAFKSSWCIYFEKGIFYGQCSELCGLNHPFMPIKVIAFDTNIKKH